MKTIKANGNTYELKMTFSGHRLFDSMNKKRLVKAMESLGTDFDVDTIGNLMYVALKGGKNDVNEAGAMEIIDAYIEENGLEALITVAVELIGEYFGVKETDNGGK